MKKLLPFILLTSLLLSACSNRKSDVFNKELACRNVSIEQIKKQLEETNNSNLEIEEIFYSPLKDSCLYTAINKATKGKFEFSPEWTLYLFDYNKKENISVWMPVKSEEFKQEIQKLKRE